MHQSSLLAMQRFVDTHLTPHRGAPLEILDVGSMDVNGSYRPFFDDPAWSYTGLDIEPGPGVDVVAASPYAWRSVRSDRFDVVISGQALEHIEFPWVTMLEIERVLRPGGISCLIAPGGGPEHRYPVDCYRYYRDGMVALARWADLDVLDAMTSWETHGVTDDSAQWMDSLLVARKPSPTTLRRVKHILKLTAVRRTAAYQAGRCVQRWAPGGVPSHSG